MLKSHNRLTLERALEIAKLPIFNAIRQTNTFKTNKLYLEHWLSKESAAYFDNLVADYSTHISNHGSGFPVVESESSLKNLIVGHENLLKELRVFQKQLFGSINAIQFEAKNSGSFQNVLGEGIELDNVTELLMGLLSTGYEVYKIQLSAVVHFAGVLKNTFLRNQDLVLRCMSFRQYLSQISHSFSDHNHGSQNIKDDILIQMLSEQINCHNVDGEKSFVRQQGAFNQIISNITRSNAMNSIFMDLTEHFGFKAPKNLVLARDVYEIIDGQEIYSYNFYSQLLSFHRYTELCMGGFVYGIDTLNGWTYYMPTTNTKAKDSHICSPQNFALNMTLLEQKLNEMAEHFSSITCAVYGVIFKSEDRLVLNSSHTHFSIQ